MTSARSGLLGDDQPVRHRVLGGDGREVADELGGVARSGKSKWTRRKNSSSLVSVNCWLSRMLPPASAIQRVTAKTSPGRSGHDRVRTNDEGTRPL